MKKNDNDIVKQVAYGILLSVGVEIIKDSWKIIKSLNSSSIDIGEWDSSYTNINKILYMMDKEKYSKNRYPSTNKEYYQLNTDTSYIIKIDKNDYMKINTYKNTKDTVLYPENRIHISIFGKNRYSLRAELLKKSAELTDKNHIRVQHLNKESISHDILPTSINNIVLPEDIKNRITYGISNWSRSKSWYQDHQLTYKMGVFLYGKPGTGKSTLVKAISSSLSNAPILTVDPQNMMSSINGIIKLRNKINGYIIVLIEDVDMFFMSREELEEDYVMEVEKKVKKDLNQNALFQLLDGIYSTDSTIYIATTNYKDRIDPALIRYGRFDIQEELNYFDKNQALNFIQLLGYGKKELDEMNIEYPVQPAFLQSKVMEHRAILLNKNI